MSYVPLSMSMPPVESCLIFAGKESIEDFAGARVLDIGAGGGELVPALLMENIEAYAVDPIYSSKKDMDASHSEHLGTAGYTPEEIAASKQPLEEFFDFMDTFPDHFVPASGEALPFANDSFNIINGSNCITRSAHRGGLFTLNCIREAMRVAKPAGEINLYPSFDFTEGISGDEVKVALLNRMHRNNVRKVSTGEDFKPRDVVLTLSMLMLHSEAATNDGNVEYYDAQTPKGTETHGARLTIAGEY